MLLFNKQFVVYILSCKLTCQHTAFAMYNRLRFRLRSNQNRIRVVVIENVLFFRVIGVRTLTIVSLTNLSQRIFATSHFAAFILRTTGSFLVSTEKICFAVIALRKPQFYSNVRILTQLGKTLVFLRKIRGSTVYLALGSNPAALNLTLQSPSYQTLPLSNFV